MIPSSNADTANNINNMLMIKKQKQQLEFLTLTVA